MLETKKTLVPRVPEGWTCGPGGGTDEHCFLPYSFKGGCLLECIACGLQVAGDSESEWPLNRHIDTRKLKPLRTFPMQGWDEFGHRTE